MKLDEKKLQEVVEKIAYQQFGQEQIDDLYAKMGILNEYVQEQLRLFTVVGRSEQFTCKHCGTHEKQWSRKNNDWYCKTCGHICK